jgi:hypothetical protein
MPIFVFKTVYFGGDLRWQIGEGIKIAKLHDFRNYLEK